MLEAFPKRLFLDQVESLIFPKHRRTKTKKDPAALRRHDRQQQFVRDRGESEAGRDLQSCGPVRIREVTAQLVALADLQRARYAAGQFRSRKRRWISLARPFCSRMKSWMPLRQLCRFSLKAAQLTAQLAHVSEYTLLPGGQRQ